MRATQAEIEKYTEYIHEHAGMVEQAWYHKLLPALYEYEPETLSSELIETVGDRLTQHDFDKISNPEILNPYARYFSNSADYVKHSSDYRKAWLLHQKMNPHHWQYWVLLNDETNPKIKALPMDLASIIEMLCDWDAASSYYGRTARLWYEEQSENMILNSKTKRIVERLLKYLD